MLRYVPLADEVTYTPGFVAAVDALQLELMGVFRALSVLIYNTTFRALEDQSA